MNNNNQIQNETNINKNFTPYTKSLIPITSAICQKLAKWDSQLNYCGINVYEVMIMGNLVSIKKDESKTILKICDMTSTIDVIFFLRNIDESLDELNYFFEEK